MTAAKMRHEAAGRVRRLADDVQETHPTMGAHNHLRDAARALDRGSTDAAQRHLRAASGLFTPQNLYRSGHLTDDMHMAGKQHMHSAHRMLLLVKDAEDKGQQEEQVRDAKRAMNAPQHLGHGRPDGTAEGPSASIGSPPYKRLPARSWVREGVESAGPKLMSRYEDDVLEILLSARTAALESTPAPRGKPGGPGLYDVKGLGHTDYYQQIVKALIEKRGMEPGKAYAIARGAIRKWARGGGKVHPEVRAAAGAAEAGELARQARAHAHSNTREAVELAAWEHELRGKMGRWFNGPGNPVESGPNIADLKMKPSEVKIYNHYRSQGLDHFQAMAMVENHRSLTGIGLANPNHDATGRFATAQNAQQGKKAAKARGFLPQHGAQRARAKGQLLARARSDEQKIAGLRALLRVLLASMRSGGSGKTSAASGASKPSASGSAAAAGKTSTSGASSKPGSSSTPSRSQAQARAAQIRQQIHGLEQQAAQLRAQAAKL
jgi:hypothetical protein